MEQHAPWTGIGWFTIGLVVVLAWYRVGRYVAWRTFSRLRAAALTDPEVVAVKAVVRKCMYCYEPGIVYPRGHICTQHRQQFPDFSVPLVLCQGAREYAMRRGWWYVLDVRMARAEERDLQAARDAREVERLIGDL